MYSIGVALGYTTGSNGKIYPHKVRINSNLRNADIKPFVQGVQTYLNENQLYDLMLEAKTDKCKTFIYLRNGHTPLRFNFTYL